MTASADSDVRATTMRAKPYASLFGMITAIRHDASPSLEIKLRLLLWYNGGGEMSIRVWAALKTSILCKDRVVRMYVESNSQPNYVIPSVAEESEMPALDSSVDF